MDYTFYFIKSKVFSKLYYYIVHSLGFNYFNLT